MSNRVAQWVAVRETDLGEKIRAMLRALPVGKMHVDSTNGPCYYNWPSAVLTGGQALSTTHDCAACGADVSKASPPYKRMRARATRWQESATDKARKSAVTRPRPRPHAASLFPTRKPAPWETGTPRRECVVRPANPTLPSARGRRRKPCSRCTKCLPDITLPSVSSTRLLRPWRE